MMTFFLLKKLNDIKHVPDMYLEILNDITYYNILMLSLILEQH